MASRTRQQIAFALLIRAEETEARAEVEALYEQLATRASPENVEAFYPAFTAGCREISTAHQQEAVRIAVEMVARQLQVESEQDLLIPTGEIVEAEAASDKMLTALELRYQGGLDVDTDRRLLLGQAPAIIAEIRVKDLQGNLPEGAVSWYSAARNAYATEVAEAINSMSSIVRYNLIALNG